jgi:hypothetical protein
MDILGITITCVVTTLVFGLFGGDHSWGGHGMVGHHNGNHIIVAGNVDHMHPIGSTDHGTGNGNHNGNAHNGNVPSASAGGPFYDRHHPHDLLTASMTGGQQWSQLPAASFRQLSEKEKDLGENENLSVLNFGHSKESMSGSKIPSPEQAPTSLDEEEEISFIEGSSSTNTGRHGGVNNPGGANPVNPGGANGAPPATLGNAKKGGGVSPTGSGNLANLELLDLDHVMAGTVGK